MEITKPDFSIDNVSNFPATEKKLKRRRVFKRSFFRKKIYLMGKFENPVNCGECVRFRS